MLTSARRASTRSWFDHAGAMGSAISRVLPHLPSHDAPEPDVRHASIRRTTHQCAGPIVEAVSGAAEKRSAALNPFGRALTRVETVCRAGRIHEYALILGEGVGLRKIP